jgi:hypothetical protein
MFTCTQYTYSHMEGGGEGIELNQREDLRGHHFTKLGRKYQHD